VKVGALDDPVWGQAAEDVSPPPARPSRRRLPMLLTLGVFLLSLALVVVLWPSQSGHPGGDPGGRILRELQPALVAVPAGSTGVVTQSLDSVWSGKCPDNPAGQAGWSEVRVDATFTTTLTKEQVTDSVNVALTRDGWVRHDESFGPRQGPVAHWTKRLASGSLAGAAVYPVPASSTNWFLTATADPPGFALPGC